MVLVPATFCGGVVDFGDLVGVAGTVRLNTASTSCQEVNRGFPW